MFCKERLGRDEPLGSIDRDKLNVNGGSLAAGHPFAATGGRIVAGLAKQLHERGGGRGADHDLRRRRPGRRRDPRERRRSTMSDRYTQLVNTPGRRLRSPSSVGLPQPVELDRYEPGGR